ncbi:microsomal glutathione S-transferase 1 [Microcaecilia unicolor]|uniref:Microsomal glutathione S-transferase 1 n=1 Tax=Microcaecilia unicolor TaxID=1415580 RepID=A0A6P7YUQ4_9AMPH|nr:microsomal glutathione S-transferase 1 [Microcaecilia unicolor]XP_030070908.1 microsomal glutathione S-transferase 1 [Microcaecilia unicolor]XP_030070909.1 microsomal glutathione S-transferase 1 [Microcaecilia unicolor]
MAEQTKLMENEVFLAYVTYSTIVLLKMMLMSSVTAYFRLTRKVFANPEDATLHATGEGVKKYVRIDEGVERVRRCHQNDLENIVPFIGIGLLYAFSSPDLFMALMHFRIFTASRIYHTIAYLTPLPQPNRGLSWMIGYGVTFSMAYTVLKNVWYL